MVRKSVLVLILAVFAMGTAFGNDEGGGKGDNSIGLDIGPLIAGGTIGSILSKATAEAPGVNVFGFGIAAQYERQMLSFLTVGIKLGYLGFGIAASDSGTDEYGNTIKATLGINLNSFTAEGHVRWYPGKNVFFLDGQLGYGYLAPTFSGEAIYTKNGKKVKESVSITTPRHYFTYGAKIGWRVIFGESGGFYFEPSFGYYGHVPMSDSFGKALAKKYGGDEETDTKAYDDTFEYLENYLFIGGPRIALVFGWNF